MKKFFATITILIFCSTLAQAQIGLPKVIGDNMVLQQGKEAKIWGTGVPGKRITVKFAGQTVRTQVAADGTWSLALAPMEASFEGRTMSISDGRSTLKLQDVLVGEVWLASGQSNMEYRMERPGGYVKQERGEDVQMQLYGQGGDERIRVMYVQKRLDEVMPSEGWKKSSKETIAEISAPAYLFARNLCDSLNVPVGIISSSWGGSEIEVWMPDSLIAGYVKSHPGAENPRVAPDRYGSKYEKMISPLAPFALRGFLWYQGESNIIDNPAGYKYYGDKQKLLIDAWRSEWGDCDLPFYYVQLAPYTYSSRRDLYPVDRQALPNFWELQQELMSVPGSGMAQTTDLVDKPGDIHPPYKHIVGQRLALWALKNEYGRSGIETLGPVFESAGLEGNRLTVTFSHSDGLTTSDGKAPDWFRVVLSNGKSARITTAIEDGKVVITLPEGSEPVELRFGWDELAMPNLRNAAGLPALPFLRSLEPVGNHPRIAKTVTPFAPIGGGDMVYSAPWKPQDDRSAWVAMMDRIARPVMSNLAAGTLKANMPYESLADDPKRVEASRLEAFGRTLCGLGPWLALGPDDTPEGQLRSEYIKMLPLAVRNAVNPESPDYLTFGRGNAQSLVDAAFLAQGMLRGGEWTWAQLDGQTRAWLVEEWKRSRSVTPGETNWLLFASMVEAALLEYTGECDTWRLRYGVHRFIDDGWYKGDGFFGDGHEVHLDYYNSLVISPMLTDVLKIMVKHGIVGENVLERQLLREQRLAAVLEKLVSPEGTYPVVGRSIVYRTGHLHALAHTVLLENLPEKLAEGQVRAAMTAVMNRQFADPGNFSGEWLTVGFSGHQINMSEPYINTGSLYMCTAFFLPLGLPADHSFWTAPAGDWTSRKAWNGVDVGADKALRDSR